MENDFFDYVTDINRLDGSNIKSGRNFGNYVVLLDSIKEAYTKISSLRWENYQIEVFNVQLNYIRSYHGNVSKEWNGYVDVIKRELERNYDNFIESFISGKGITNVEKFKDVVKGILVLYGVLKSFGMLENSDVPDILIVGYEMLKLGYIPCGCAGKIPVGGSLYVY